MNKLMSWLKKNACVNCDYYIKTNKTCQSKKCVGVIPYVNWIDRHFCKPYKYSEEHNLLKRLK